MINPLFGPKQTVKLLPDKQALPTIGNTKIISIVSTVGRSGKSTIALNLAKMLGSSIIKGEKHRVLLLDGNLQQTGISLRTNGTVTDNFLNLSNHIKQQTALAKPDEYVFSAYTEFADPSKDFLLQDHSIGVDTISSDFDYGKKRYAPQDLRNVLSSVSEFYDVIVIDCGSDVECQFTRTWLDCSWKIIMTAPMELDALYQTSKATRFLCQHPLDSSKRIEPSSICFALSKADAKQTIAGSTTFLKDMFPWSNDFFFVPDAPELVQNANQGKLLVQQKSFQEALIKMAVWLV